VEGDIFVLENGTFGTMILSTSDLKAVLYVNTLSSLSHGSCND